MSLEPPRATDKTPARGGNLYSQIQKHDPRTMLRRMVSPGSVPAELFETGHEA